MNDPREPGGFVPPAGSYVIISAKESGMDTDESSSVRSLKKSHVQAME